MSRYEQWERWITTGTSLVTTAVVVFFVWAWVASLQPTAPRPYVTAPNVPQIAALDAACERDFALATNALDSTLARDGFGPALRHARWRGACAPEGWRPQPN